jgi:hypothetical protein
MCIDGPVSTGRTEEIQGTVRFRVSWAFERTRTVEVSLRSKGRRRLDAGCFIDNNVNDSVREHTSPLS